MLMRARLFSAARAAKVLRPYCDQPVLPKGGRQSLCGFVVLSQRYHPRWSPRRLSTSSKPPTSQQDIDGHIRERAQQLFKQWTAQSADAWKKNVVQFLGIGGIAGVGIGGLTALGVLGWYLNNNPNAVEKIVVDRIAAAFNSAIDFEARKTAYYNLPEFQFPIPDAVALAESFTEASGSSTLTPISIWASKILDTVNSMETSVLMKTKKLMRQSLVYEALQEDDIRLRLRILRDILPPSVERDVVMNQELAKEKWVDGVVLEENLQKASPEFTNLENIVLTTSISTFPGPINQLILFLGGSNDIESLAIAAFPKDQSSGDVKEFKEAVTWLKGYFEELSARERKILLRTALSRAVKSLPNLPSINGEKPYDLYVRTVESELLGPLRRDARITADILDEVRVIFLGLPADIQAKILLTAITHESAKENSRESQAAVVRDLLGSGGVVAIKLAQMLAEDPKVPLDYRTLLGSLRDSNKPMPLASFWRQIPATIRSQIDKLGPCLGTGSVKQVHKFKFRPTESTKLKTKDYAIAILRQDVEHECMSALNALEQSPALGLITERLASLMFGEFNLYAEGEALIEFGGTSIGRHPKFNVVEVKHHSPKCLIEEIADGISVARAVEIGNEHSEAARDLLTEYHRVVFKAFTDDNLIHSDIHLGNAVMGSLPNGGIGFSIYDIAQVERSTESQTVALLWLLAAISNPERRISLKGIAVRHLLAVSHGPGANSSSISDAFNEAIAPFENGEIPDQKTAYMLFLRAAEARSVALPKAAFAVAKMVDAMLVQQKDFGLAPVVDEGIEQYLWKHLSWRDTAQLVNANVTSLLWRPSVPKAPTPLYSSVNLKD